MTSPELLRYPELKARYNLPYTFAHLCRLSKAGKFPPKIKLSHRCVAWVAGDVERWISERTERAA